MKKHGLFLVDDHALFIQCFESYIRQDNTFHWMGSSMDIQEGYEKIAFTKPDIVLIDFHLNNESGLDLLSMIRDLPFTIKPVFLTMNRDAGLKNYILSSGAKGYLLKYMEAKDIISALLEIANNDIVYNPPEHLFDYPANKKHNPMNLTGREFEIASLVCKGHTSQEIAKKLFLSTLTVQTHRRNILRKLDVKTTMELFNLIQPFI